jgi:hypothetical protein
MYRNRSNSKDCAIRSNRKVEGNKNETVFLQYLHKTPRLHLAECFEKCHIFRHCNTTHSTETLRAIILVLNANMFYLWVELLNCLKTLSFYGKMDKINLIDG